MIPIVLLSASVAAIMFWKSGISSFEYMWIYRWALAVGLVFVLALLPIRKKLPSVLWISCLYFVLQAHVFATMPLLHASNVDVLKDLALSAAYSAATAAAVSAFVFLSPRNGIFFSLWLRGVLVGAAAIITGAVLCSESPRVEVLIMHNPSITGTLIAIMLPMVIHCWPAAMLFLLAIGMTHSYVAMGVAAVVVALRFAPTAWVAAGGAAALVMAHMFVPLQSLGNGRFEAWKTALSWWWAQDWWIWVFGAGAGSLPIILPLEQRMGIPPGTYTPAWLFMHNDWLQILFEQGAVGLALAAAVFAGALWKVRARQSWTAGLLAYGVAMCANFPMRYPLGAIMGICLIGGAYFEDPRDWRMHGSR